MLLIDDVNFVLSWDALYQSLEEEALVIQVNVVVHEARGVKHEHVKGFVLHVYAGFERT